MARKVKGTMKTMDRRPAKRRSLRRQLTPPTEYEAKAMFNPSGGFILH